MTLFCSLDCSTPNWKLMNSLYSFLSSSLAVTSWCSSCLTALFSCMTVIAARHCTSTEETSLLMWKSFANLYFYLWTSICSCQLRSTFWRSYLRATTAAIRSFGHEVSLVFVRGLVSNGVSAIKRLFDSYAICGSLLKVISLVYWITCCSIIDKLGSVSLVGGSRGITKLWSTSDLSVSLAYCHSVTPLKAESLFSADSRASASKCKESEPGLSFSVAVVEPLKVSAVDVCCYRRCTLDTLC